MKKEKKKKANPKNLQQQSDMETDVPKGNFKRKK